MTDQNITLSAGELSFLKNILDTGDRAGYYLAYSQMVGGSPQSLLQAEISSFSGGVGGLAWYQNYITQWWFESFNSDDYYPGIYSISQSVAEAHFVAVSQDANSLQGNGGVLSDIEIYNTAYNTWDVLGLKDYFPGLLFDFTYNLGNLVDTTLTNAIEAAFTILEDCIDIHFNIKALRECIIKDMDLTLPENHQAQETLNIHFRSQRSRYGELILSDNTDDPLGLPPHEVKQLVSGIVWRDELFSGKTFREIGKTYCVAHSYVQRSVYKSFEILEKLSL